MFFSKKSLAFTPEDAAFIFSKLQPQLQNAAPTSFYPTRSGSGIVTADHLRNQLDDILNARQVLDPNGRVSLAQIAEFLDLDNAILLPLLDQAVLKAGAYQANNVYFTVYVLLLLLLLFLLSLALASSLLTAQTRTFSNLYRPQRNLHQNALHLRPRIWQISQN